MLRKLDPPMSNWFCSVPHAMDTISYSIKAREPILHCCLMAEGLSVPTRYVNIAHQVSS